MQISKIAFTVATFVTVQCYAAVFDFDTASDLSHFDALPNISPNSGMPAWEPIGLGGTGAIRPVGSYASLYMVNKDRSYPLSIAGEAVELSVMLRYEHPQRISGGGGVYEDIIGVGMTSEPTRSYIFETQLLASLRLSQLSPTDEIVTEVLALSYSGTNGSGRRYPIGTLTSGHWYRLYTKFSIIDAARPNLFDITLDDFGPNGVSIVENVFTESVNWTGFAPVKDATMWAGFTMSRRYGVGAEAVDNFTIIPEPSIVTLLLPAVLIWGRFNRQVAAGP